MAKREYTNGELIVYWNSDLCTHCETCWRGLPQVFNPNVRPWVDMTGADSDLIVGQILQCPSGALSLVKSNC